MPDSYVLKVRCGRGAYIKEDGRAGTGGRGGLVDKEVTFTLATSQDMTLFDGNGGEYVVRRLTPTECERLQGFPDGWTDIPYRGSEHSQDAPRYKALGNSMAVPVMRWIGERIELVEEVMHLNHRYKEARVKAGIRAEQAAAQLGISLTTLYNWERGDTFPDANKVVEMVKLYGTTSDFLLGME